jgi:hypothetical protein
MKSYDFVNLKKILLKIKLSKILNQLVFIYDVKFEFLVKYNIKLKTKTTFILSKINCKN